jgi:hypothetical protein
MGQLACCEGRRCASRSARDQWVQRRIGRASTCPTGRPRRVLSATDRGPRDRREEGLVSLNGLDPRPLVQGHQPRAGLAARLVRAQSAGRSLSQQLTAAHHAATGGSAVRCRGTFDRGDPGLEAALHSPWLRYSNPGAPAQERYGEEGTCISIGWLPHEVRAIINLSAAHCVDCGGGDFCPYSAYNRFRRICCCGLETERPNGRRKCRRKNPDVVRVV